MFSRSSIVVLLALACAASLPAQRLWVVDLLNRPGTDFTDLQVAVDAAAPGDVLSLRYVDPVAHNVAYSAPTITGKGITIVGDPVRRPEIHAVVTIRNIPAGQSVVLAHVNLASEATRMLALPAPLRGMTAANCTGSIHVHGVRFGYDYALGGYGESWPLTFERCQLVTISSSRIWQCDARNAVRCYRSRLVATDSEFRETWPIDYITSRQTISATMLLVFSEAWFTNCMVRGTSGTTWYPDARSAVYVCGSRLWIGAGCWFVEGAGLSSGIVSAAAGGMAYSDCYLWPVPDVSTAYFDPRATFVGGIYPNGSPALIHVFDSVSTLAWTLSSTSQSIAVPFASHASAPAVVVTGLLRPSPSPQPYGDLFLDPTSLVTLAVGVTDSAGLLPLTFPVAPWPALGTTVGVQAAALTSTGTLVLTPPIAPGRY